MSRTISKRGVLAGIAAVLATACTMTLASPQPAYAGWKGATVNVTKTVVGDDKGGSFPFKMTVTSKDGGLASDLQKKGRYLGSITDADGTVTTKDITPAVDTDDTWEYDFSLTDGQSFSMAIFYSSEEKTLSADNDVTVNIQEVSHDGYDASAVQPTNATNLVADDANANWSYRIDTSSKETAIASTTTDVTNTEKPKPVTPTAPVTTTPTTVKKDVPKSTIPKTGDDLPTSIISAIIVIAGMGAVTTMFYRRHMSR